MAYKELQIDELNTGQLAAAYQKIENSMSRVAGGCWVFKNNKTTKAVNHRLHISCIRHIDRPADIEAVKTIDLVRYKNGFRLEAHSGYEMSCHNEFCFNPAHQVRPKQRYNKTAWSPEMMEKCGLLRKNGWSTHYQRSETNEITYVAILKETAYTPIVPLTLPSLVKMDVVAKLFELFHPTHTLPTIDEMLEHTGLAFEELLPYGYAVAALEQRTKSEGRREVCGAMIRGFLQEKPIKEIALLNGIQPAQIHLFKGALYG